MEHMPHIGFLTTRTGTRRGAALALALLLAGCGGGGGGADPVVQAGADALPAVATPAEDAAAGGTPASATELAAAGAVERMCKWRPGTLPAGTLCPSTLLQSQFLNTLSAADIQSALATKGSYVEGVTPRYAVTSYKLEYMTTDDMVNKFAGGAPTALKSGLPEAADTDSLHAAAVTMFNGKTGMASAVQDALNQTARGVLFASVKDVVTGTLAPEEAIETALATPLADS